MFTRIEMLNLLWLLPVLLIASSLADSRRKRALSRLAGANARAAVASSRNGGACTLRYVLWSLAAIALVITLAGPAWNPVEETIQREGREVVFLLDVSRSMLAQDLRPSRLERAKADIADCIEGLHGDRVALVVFAGKAAVQCPLTQDYGFFRMQLADASPESVSRGGTALGDAIRQVQEKLFTDDHKAFRDVILITDGEDHESYPVEAARKLGDAGVRLIAIGIGDDNAGTPIEVTNESGRREILKYNGEVVRSKLDSKTLREMAAATPGGVYLPLGTAAMDLRKIYRQLVDEATKNAFDDEKIVSMEQKFQIFLGAAMLLLTIAALLPHTRKVAVAIIMMLSVCAAMQAQEPQQENVPTEAPAEETTVDAPRNQSAAKAAFKEANHAYAQNDFETAKSKYAEAEANVQSGLKYIKYNQGLNAAAQNDFVTAKEAFTQAALANAQTADNNGDDISFAVKCEANAASAGFNLAQQHIEQQKLQEAKTEIDECNERFDKAVKLAPANEKLAEDARKAQMLRKRIQYLLKQQPPQQQQQQQQEQQDQQDKQDNQQQEQQEQEQEQQQNQNQQDNQQQEQQEQEQQQNQNQQDNQQQEQQEQEQQQNQNQQDNQQQEKQQQSAQQQQQNDDQKQEKQPSQQLDRELQKIIDSEKQRRLQKKREQSQQAPVEKDW